MNAAPHDAVLLAAGGSTRLGRPKQLLRRDGESLLRRTARMLSGTSPRALIVVLGADEQAMRAELEGLDVVVAVNPAWREGLSGSLRVAAANLGRGARVLVSVCDQPALEARHFDALLAHGGTAATRHGERFGVPAVLDAATWARVHELQGDRGFGALLDPSTCAGLDAPELGFDLDTPGDVARARVRRWLD